MRSKSHPPATISASDSPAHGRASVYEYLQRERHVPAFLMEQRIIRGPKLGRQPASQDRLRFGRELLQAAAHAVQE